MFDLVTAATQNVERYQEELEQLKQEEAEARQNWEAAPDGIRKENAEKLWTAVVDQMVAAREGLTNALKLQNNALTQKLNRPPLHLNTADVEGRIARLVLDDVSRRGRVVHGSQSPGTRAKMLENDIFSDSDRQFVPKDGDSILSETEALEMEKHPHEKFTVAFLLAKVDLCFRGFNNLVAVDSQDFPWLAT